jgi:hypothetical protein
MDMDAPCFLYTDDTVYGKYFEVLVRILLFFCCRTFMLKVHQSGAPCFLYAVLRV